MMSAYVSKVVARSVQELGLGHAPKLSRCMPAHDEIHVPPNVPFLDDDAAPWDSKAAHADADVTQCLSINVRKRRKLKQTKMSGLWHLRGACGAATIQTSTNEKVDARKERKT